MKLSPALEDRVDPKSWARYSQGAAAALIAVGLFGFGWFGVPNVGFTTSGTASRAAAQSFVAGKYSILAIPCAAAVSARVDAAEMRKKFGDAKDAWDFGRVFDDAEAKKLVTIKGESWPDNDMAMACGKIVLADVKKTAAK